MSDSVSRYVGWAAAGGGTFATLVQDHLAGLTVTGIVSGMIALSGGFYVAYGNIRKLIEARNDQRRVDLRKDKEAELERKALEQEAAERADERLKTTLSGQLAALRADLAEQAAEHRRDSESAARYQAELKAALDLSNENYQRMRESLHAARNQLQALMGERDELKAANAQLSALLAGSDRTEAKVDRLDRKADRIKAAVREMSGSSDEIPSDAEVKPLPESGHADNRAV